MLTGKTKTGFEFELDEEAKDDMEFLDALVDFTKGNKARFPELVSIFFGEEQKRKLYEHCRSENGRVLASKVEIELINVLDAIREMSEKSEKSEVKN